MSGVVSFFWLDDRGDGNYFRVPRDEVRGVRLSNFANEIEIQLAGSYQDISISIDPTEEQDQDHRRKIGNKMIDSMRSLTDEDVSWEWNGDRWEKQKAKNQSVWGAS